MIDLSHKLDATQFACVLILLLGFMGCGNGTAHDSLTSDAADTTKSIESKPIDSSEAATKTVQPTKSPRLKSPPSGDPVAASGIGRINQSSIVVDSNTSVVTPSNFESTAPAISESSVSPESVAAFRQLELAYRQQDPQSWTRAEQSLLQFGKNALPILAQHLTHGDAISKELAIMMLARLGEVALESSASLLAVLHDESKIVRANAAAILSLDEKFATHVVPVLVEFLDGSDIELNILAATALGNLGVSARAAVPRLKTLRTHSEARLRTAASTALELIEPKQSPMR